MQENRSKRTINHLEQEIGSKYNGVYAYPHESEEERKEIRKIMKQCLNQRKSKHV